MNQQNQQPEQQNKEHRWDSELLKKGLHCDLDQYEMLKRCSDKKDIAEWNKWRKENPKKEIWLQGANLRKAYLVKANLINANLDQAIFNSAIAEEVNLVYANLSHSQFFATNLKNAQLGQEQEAFEVTFHNITFLGFNAEGLEVFSNLKNAIFWYADLRGACLSRSYLYGSHFRWVKLDGETTLIKCKIDKNTDFRETGLNSARIDTATKQLLEYNIRRMNWEEWYKDHIWLKWLVKPFWWISDYGISTTRIIFTFFGLAVFSAIIYYAFGLIHYPGIVSSLFVIEGTQETISPWLVPFRAVYFSIVTMTTLGFGDMYANSQSIFGHILLTIQVILGYVLLGALVTRFAVLFTAGGPAGKFEDEKKED